jgi:integrase
MAWIEPKTRSDGGTSYSVRWRLGGTRDGRPQVETFGAGSDARNLARAEGFKQMVTAAGEHWPEGWVKGAGFVREHSSADVTTLPRSVEEVGLEYVGQIVDCSPGQRSRYRGQLRVLKGVEVAGHRGPYRPFDARIDTVTEADIKAWLIGWNRSLKTKANYHGLLYGVFNYALEKGEIAQQPLLRTAPKRSKIRQSQADLRFLTEAEFTTTAEVAKDAGDLLRVTVGTGMRYGEVTALWVSDVDLRHRTVRVNKAWKRDGEDGEQDVPSWLRKQLRSKHAMRGHHLGKPKTPKSRRTIEISEAVAEILTRHVAGKAADDFVFVTPTGLPLHNADYYERVWTPLMGAIGQKGIAPFRFHDLRHTHVSWLIAGGVPLPHIQARLGHESITTTIDTYGHLLPLGGDLISQVIDTALRGEEIQPAPAMRLIQGGRRDESPDVDDLVAADRAANSDEEWARAASGASAAPGIGPDSPMG